MIQKDAFGVCRGGRLALPVFSRSFRGVWLFLVLLLGLSFNRVYGQQEVIVNMSGVDGQSLNPDNILRFQVQSRLSHPVRATVTGNLVYRGSGLRMGYRFTCTLSPGMNVFDVNEVHPQYTFSVGSLGELFLQYRRLPEGTYEYCVQVSVPDAHAEAGQAVYSDCIYNKSEDLFLLNLVSPENNAKLYEYHPLLTWSVNYPFASMLEYRLRVAAVKRGQNAAGAISRNNPVFDVSHLVSTAQMYPVYAKALEVNQPYAWTVDAYYRGLLLGGAEPWIFTIVEDTVWKHIPLEPSFIDVRKESGRFNLYAPGKIKLRYNVTDFKTDTLSFKIMDMDGNTLSLKTEPAAAVYGENRYVIDLYNDASLKHLKQYRLMVADQHGGHYSITFKYVNPDLIQGQ